MDRTFSQNKDLLIELTKTSFKLRYNGSVLGIMWVLLKPLLIFAIQYTVFSTVFSNNNVNNYPIYLLTGILIYNYFSESIIFGMNSLLDKAHIILKVNFTKNIAVLSAILMAFVNLAVNLIVFVAFAIFSDINLTFNSLLYAFIVLFNLTLLLYGVALFTSIIAVKIRDLKNIFEILIQLGYYLVPIFYPISIIPDRFRPFVEYNPLTVVIQTLREAVVNGHVAYFEANIAFIFITIVIVVIGTIFFERNIRKIAEYY